MPHIPEQLLEHVGPFLMVVFRISGLFVFAPILSSTSIPAQARVLLALAMSVALYPSVPLEAISASGAGGLRLDLFSLIPAVLGETLIGAAIGLIASIPMYFVQMAGVIMGQQTGMSLGGLFNPALDIETDAISQLLMSIALAAFVAAGGLEVSFLALARSFEHVAIGGASWGGASIAPVAMLVGLISSGFELALRVAAPVVCILLVETIASAYLMRTIPQINIMSIGYGVKVVLALVVMAGAVMSFHPVIYDDIADAIGACRVWVESLANGPGQSYRASVPEGAR